MKKTAMRNITIFIATTGVMAMAGCTPRNPMLDSAMKLKDCWVESHMINSAVVATAEPVAGRRTALPFSFIYEGKQSDLLLPEWKKTVATDRMDSACTRRTLTWTDLQTGLEVKCVAIIYGDLPAVEWLLYFTNTGGKDTPIIESVQPLDTQFVSATGEYRLHHSLGESNSPVSFAPSEEVIRADNHNVLAFSPVGGRSSDGQMPYFNLDCGGSGAVIAIGWAGQWRSSFQQISDGCLRATAGQELTHFRLHPGETVRTPRILMTFWQAADDICGNNLFRQVIISHYLPRRNGRPIVPPICASVNETAPDGTYTKPHQDAGPVFKAAGFEVFWFDMNPQHWYGDFPKDTGTWEPDLKRLPGGLKPIADAAHNNGMGFLLWFEPERVQPGTKIDKIHPEWVMELDGEGSRLFRMHDKQARKWLTDYIDVQITIADLDWIRWDFNLHPLGFWRRNDEPDRQGITEMKYIEGLYAMWQELQRRHPGLLVDICASGGRRLDFETCSYGIPLWQSDMQCSGMNPMGDQLQNGGLWRWLPMHTCGIRELEPNYGFRSAMTGGGVIAARRNDRSAAVQPACTEEVSKTVAVLKKFRPYLLGDFYPLFPHDLSENSWYGYQFHRPEEGDGVAVIFRRANNKQNSRRITLRGVDESTQYEVTFEDTAGSRIVSGKDLSDFEINLPWPASSTILYYRPR